MTKFIEIEDKLIFIDKIQCIEQKNNQIIIYLIQANVVFDIKDGTNPFAALRDFLNEE